MTPDFLVEQPHTNPVNKSARKPYAFREIFRAAR